MRTPFRHLVVSVTAVTLLVGAVCTPATAQDWWVAKPSNTGVPGEEIRLTRWAPDGTLWVAARHPFWVEGGIGIWDPVAETWTVLSSWETPLGTPFVNDLEFEADGTAWIATSSGLVRLVDGAWTIWDSNNSPLTSDVIRDLSLAPDGHIWINATGTGPAIYDFDGVSDWARYAVPNEIPFASPWTELSQVFVDSQGIVWVANNVLNGVARFDGRNWTLHGQNVNRFDEMAEDAFGNLWLNANLVGGLDAFHRFDGTTFTTYSQPEPTMLMSDPETGDIYFGNWFGQVKRTTDGGQTFETFLTGLNKVFDIAPRPGSDEVWIGTIGAVGQFAGDSTWLRDFNSWNSGMPDYFVDYFWTDPEGYFWVATGEAGLSRFDGKRWRNWGNHNVGSEPYPFAGNEPMAGVFMDSTGTHWMGGNGIARWDSGTGQFTGFWNWQNNPGMGVTMFPFFAEDAAGDVFACTEHGTVYRFNETTQLWDKEPIQIYAVSGMPNMMSDEAGDVWAVGWFDIYHWNGNTWSTVTLPNPDFFFDLGGINEFRIGPDGRFWFGTVEGLVRWDGTSFELFDTTNSPLHAPFVTGLDIRSDGLLAIAARNGGGSQPSGLSVVDGDIADPANWTSYLYGVAPIPHWQIDRCSFDAQGNIWLSAISEGAAVLLTGSWEDLGRPLAGTHGTPHVVGSGQPVPTDSITLALANAPRGALAGLVVGLGAVDAPFKGGTLVPDPQFVIPGLATDANGVLTVSGPWPSGIPGGTTVVMQFWIPDVGGPAGFAASNAVAVSTP